MLGVEINGEQRHMVSAYLSRVETECWNGLLVDEEDGFKLISISLEKVWYRIISS